MNFRFLFFLSILALFSVSSGAQIPDLMQDLEDEEESDEFFLSDPTQVLVGENITSQTLDGAQFEVENNLADLRETIRNVSNPSIFRAQVDQFVELYDQYIMMTRSLYPEKDDGLVSVARKSQALIENLRLDYEDRDFAQASVTFRLLENSWREYLSLTEHNRLKRSLESSPLTPSVPIDWNSEIPDEQVVSTTNWTLLNGREISSRISNQVDVLYQDRFRNMDENNLNLINDMHQASIMLRDRVGELAVPSRVGFVHASLQLEVQAENLREYYKERNFHAFRRQLQLMREVLQKVDEYYQVRKLLEN